MITGRRHADRAGRPRAGLGRVARRDRDHAGRPFGVAEGEDPVDHATGLERAGLLEVLGLDLEPPARESRAARLRDQPGRGRRRQHRRPVDRRGDSLAGGLDRGEADDPVGGVHGSSIAEAFAADSRTKVLACLRKH
jgi:hypothetical protein